MTQLCWPTPRLLPLDEVLVLLGNEVLVVAEQVRLGDLRSVESRAGASATSAALTRPGTAGTPPGPGQVRPLAAALGDQALAVAREVRTEQTSGSPAYPILVHGVLDLAGEQPSGFLVAVGVAEAGEHQHLVPVARERAAAGAGDGVQPVDVSADRLTAARRSPAGSSLTVRPSIAARASAWCLPAQLAPNDRKDPRTRQPRATGVDPVFSSAMSDGAGAVPPAGAPTRGGSRLPRPPGSGGRRRAAAAAWRT